ncbi:hypothetical protein GCM10009541_23360 [Micromonospora gifhornensis]|uniref:Uncharacterized protein n=1 Tax=Micromonospora gifhornensis TaxID=84594 RepID=A0ABQ4IHU1_9ACTN|nr:hypothetical protein Vgi01_39670 [Micromonospora gifhornensis]
MHLTESDHGFLRIAVRPQSSCGMRPPLINLAVTCADTDPIEVTGPGENGIDPRVGVCPGGIIGPTSAGILWRRSVAGRTNVTTTDIFDSADASYPWSCRL